MSDGAERLGALGLDPASLAAALDGLADVVLPLDPDGRLQWSNDGFAWLVDGDPARYRGRRVTVGLTDQGGGLVEHWFPRADGTSVAVELRCSPLRDVTGTVTHLLAVGRSRSEAQGSDVAYLQRIVGALEEHVYCGEMAPDGIFLEHYAGPNLEHFVGRHLEPHEDSDTAWAAAVHPDDRDAYYGSDDALRRGEASQLEYRMVHPDGTTLWVWERIWPRRQPDGRLLLDGIVTDVTERRRMLLELEEAGARLRSVVEAVDEYFYCAESLPDGSVDIVYTGPGRDRMLGRLPCEDHTTDAWPRAIHPDDRAAVERVLRHRDEQPGEMEYRLVGADGKVRWVWDRFRPRRDADGRLFFDGVVSDVTERRLVADALAAARDDAERRSRTDELTGVANRRHFAEALGRALAAAPAERRQPAVLLLDVDRFKRVNDTYGHGVGDDVLVAVAGRIRHHLRPGDLVARFGGEEFVVLVDDVPDDEALRRIGEGLRRAIAATPIRVGAELLTVTASVGAARADGGDDLTADALVDAADAALYVAKRRGRNQTRLAAEARDLDGHVEDSEPGTLARALALAASLREGMPSLHAEQVADLAGRIAERLGLPPTTARRCRLGGLLHDIGKIAIPDRVLAKPAALTAAEQEVMRMHAEMGEQMARHIAGLDDAAAGVRHHHERWDGAGYPDRLAGTLIPLDARIIAAADAYSAMTCARVYSEAKDQATAIADLRAEAGRQFDPGVVDALCAVLDETRARVARQLAVGDAAA